MNYPQLKSHEQITDCLSLTFICSSAIKSIFLLLFLMKVYMERETSHWDLAPSSSSSSGVGVGGGREAPPIFVEREEHWRHIDNSVNAVSFGFVATAILISMFLIMAIFERLLWPSRSSSSSSHSSPQNHHPDLESHMAGFNPKIDYPSPKMSIYSRGVSVLMPGDEIPTFIAHPAPAPCPPESLLLPLNHHIPPSSFTLNTT